MFPILQSQIYKNGKHRRLYANPIKCSYKEVTENQELTSFLRIISLTRIFPPNNEYEDGCGTLGDSPSSPVDTGVT